MNVKFLLKKQRKGFTFYLKINIRKAYYMIKISIDQIFNPDRSPVIFASVPIILHGVSGADAQRLVGLKVYTLDTDLV